MKRRPRPENRPPTRPARGTAPRATRPAATRGKATPVPARGGAARRTAARRTPARAGSLTARDLMREDVITIDQSAPLSEVERILIENRISGAPVTDETGAIVGVVSIRDLVERYAEDPDARPRRGRGWFHMDTDDLEEEDVESSEVPEEAEETARDVMTAEVYSVPDSASLGDVARAMSVHRIHRVLVEAGGRYVGLVTTMDLLGALAGRRAPKGRAR